MYYDGKDKFIFYDGHIKKYRKLDKFMDRIYEITGISISPVEYKVKIDYEEILRYL